MEYAPLEEVEEIVEYRKRLEDLGALAAPLAVRATPWSVEAKRTPNDAAMSIMTVTPPLYVRHDDEKAALEREVRGILATAGIREHRALISGDKDDADAYMEALKELDDAMARLWALHAFGALHKRVSVMARRTAAAEEVKDALLARPKAFAPPLDEAAALKSVNDARAAHGRLVAATPVSDDMLCRVVDLPALAFEDKASRASREAIARRKDAVKRKIQRKKK